MKLSSIIQSPSKTKYFTATMHDESSSKSLVSYNIKLYGTTEQAKLKDKPVILLNFTENVNPICDRLQVKLGYQSLVNFLSEKISFGDVKNLIDQAEETWTLKQIIDNGCIGQMVNIVARIDLDSWEV